MVEAEFQHPGECFQPLLRQRFLSRSEVSFDQSSLGRALSLRRSPALKFLPLLQFRSTARAPAQSRFQSLCVLRFPPEPPPLSTRCPTARENPIAQVLERLRPLHSEPLSISYGSAFLFHLRGGFRPAPACNRR